MVVVLYLRRRYLNMVFYWGLWCLFLILALLWRDKHYKRSYQLLALLIYILAILTGGRQNVGADWESYQTYYNTGYAYDKVSGQMEPLFGLIRTVCYGLGCSYGFFCLVCCLISLLALHKAIRMMGVRNCFMAFLVYLSLFFCNYQFNIVRHGVLASILLLGMSYLAMGKTWKSLFCVIVSCGFHLMGIIFIPLIFIFNKTLSKKWFLIIAGIAILIFIADLSGRIVAAFPFLAMIDRVSSYVDADTNEAYKLSIGIIGFFTIAAFSIFFKRDIYENNTAFRICANMVLLGFIVFCGLNAFSAIVQRVGNLLNLGVVILLPFIWQELERTKKRVLVRVLIIIYLALYYPKSWYFSNGDGEYPMLPFRTNIVNLL